MAKALYSPAGYGICGRVARDTQGGMQVEAVMAPPLSRSNACKWGSPTLVHQKRGRAQFIFCSFTARTPCSPSQSASNPNASDVHATTALSMGHGVGNRITPMGIMA